MTKELNSNNFNETINQENKLILVDFWAPWCGPCKIIAPILDEISSNTDENIIISKLNVDDNPEIAAQFGIRNIPTLLFFKNGQIVDKTVGVSTKSNLENKIQTLR
jgi:thioredoxin 1